MVAGITVAMLAGKGQVSARRVRGTGVSLINVSARFVRAVKEQRAEVEADEEDEDSPPARKSRRQARE